MIKNIGLKVIPHTHREIFKEASGYLAGCYFDILGTGIILPHQIQPYTKIRPFFEVKFCLDLTC